MDYFSQLTAAISSTSHESTRLRREISRLKFQKAELIDGLEFLFHKFRVARSHDRDCPCSECIHLGIIEKYLGEIPTRKTQLKIVKLENNNRKK